MLPYLYNIYVCISIHNRILSLAFDNKLLGNNNDPINNPINCAINYPISAANSLIVFLIMEDNYITSVPEQSLGVENGWRKSRLIHGSLIFSCDS